MKLFTSHSSDKNYNSEHLRNKNDLNEKVIAKKENS